MMRKEFVFSQVRESEREREEKRVEIARKFLRCADKY
jgi:hypothetical protein